MCPSHVSEFGNSSCFTLGEGGEITQVFHSYKTTQKDTMVNCRPLNIFCRLTFIV